MATIKQVVVWVDISTKKRFSSEAAAKEYLNTHADANFEVRKLGWKVQIRKKGYKPRTKTFQKKALAERWARKIEAEMDRGEYQDTRKAERTQIKDLLDSYDKDVAKKKQGYTNSEQYRIKTLKKDLGHFSVAGLTPDDVVEYAETRLKKISSASLKRELNILADALKVADAVWGIPVPANPVTRAKTWLSKRRVLTPDKRRKRRLQPGECGALLGVPHKQYTTIDYLVGFALETAMRREELSRMRRGHVNKKKHTLRIPESKTDWKTGEEGRVIALSPAAIWILNQLPARTDGKVWGLQPRSITQAFDRLCAKADITGLHFHDLRHEATSRLFEAGHPIEEVASITGHKDIRTLMSYTHVRPERLAEKMRA